MKKTIVEKKQEMATIKSSIEEKIKAYNEALLDNKPFDVVSKIDTDIKDGIKEYTTLARDVCFDEIAMAENPMVEAAKRLNFETIAVKDEKKTDSLPQLISLYHLTRKEAEVVELIFEEYANPEIARRLQITEHTLQKHLQNIYRKLQISARWELLKFR